MAQKKTKSFSPYSYGVVYRKPGQNPFRKYEYIPTGGTPESVYVVTKRKPEYFCSIKNTWYFSINDQNVVSFVKCDSTISVSNQVQETFTKQESIIKTTSNKTFNITNSEGDNYYWQDNKTLDITHGYGSTYDSIILLNNEYYDQHCQKYYQNGFMKVKFDRQITNSDIIKSIIYLVSPKEDSTILNFSTISLTLNNLIDDDLNNAILIPNQNGTIQYKYIIKDYSNKVYTLGTFDVGPLYISINKVDFEYLDDLMEMKDSLINRQNVIKQQNGYSSSLTDEQISSINDDYNVLTISLNQIEQKIQILNQNNKTINIQSIIGYTTTSNIKTFIIQNHVDSNNIMWNGNSVIIQHDFNSEVNFIIDANDKRKIIKSIKKLNENQLQITFNTDKYIPNVFSIAIFSIGD